jgi:acyl carrier protein
LSSPHDDLIAAISSWSMTAGNGLGRDTSLIASGRLDSTALFQLLFWIEERVGRPIDVTAVDMSAEWDTVDAIVSYVARERKPR